MKKYIQRIDELGRISLPKVIIDKYNLDNSGSIEITINNNLITLRDYSPLKKNKYMIIDIIKELEKALNHSVVITDLNVIISSNKRISKELKESIFRRENILEKHPKKLLITDKDLITPYIINSIISNNDIIGLLIIYDENGVDEIDYMISNAVSKFIGKYIEQ